MGTITVKQCDVFRTVKTPIHTYRVSLKRVQATGDVDEVVFAAERDLSDRALKRLLRLVERGLAPPK